MAVAEKQRSHWALLFLQDMTAGGVSGIVAKTCSAPIERIKLLLQTQHVNRDLKLKYAGIVDCTLRVYREQGFLSFWRGNVANLLRYFPSQALAFAFKDRFRTFFVGDASKESFSRMFFGNLCSAGAAGAVSLSVVYPLEMARTRIATDVTLDSKRRFVGTLDCIRQIYASAGIKGVYAGFGVSLVGVVFFRAIFMGGYDIAKQVLDLDAKKANGESKSNFGTRFVVAQVVTTVSGTVSYPLDTVRRRVMMQSVSTEGIKVYQGAWDCFLKICKHEGVKGLFSGLGANLIRGISGSLLLVGYDEIKKMFPLN